MADERYRDTFTKERRNLSETETLEGLRCCLSLATPDDATLLLAIITREAEVLFFPPGIYSQPTMLLADWFSARSTRPYRQRAAEVTLAGALLHHEGS